MAIDIKDIIRAAQKRSSSATPTTPTNDLLYLLTVAERADQNAIYSGNVFDLVNGNKDPSRIYYNTDDKSLYFAKDEQLKQLVGPGLSYIPLYGGSNFGYTAGGWQTPGDTFQIRKFPFASDTAATNVGNISVGQAYNNTGVANSQGTQGYIFGGSASATIDTFTYSSDTIGAGGPTAAFFPRLGQINGLGGMNNDESGFIAGALGATTAIEKFDFASGTPIVTSDWGDTPSAIAPGIVAISTTTDKPNNRGFVHGNGDLVNVNFSSANVSLALSEGEFNNIYRNSADATSSSTHGYISGGLEAPGITSRVDKFSFASYVETNVGSPGQPWAHRFGAGQTSATDGYTSGGADPGLSHIVKYPFSSDTGIAARVNGLGTAIGQAAPLFF